MGEDRFTLEIAGGIIAFVAAGMRDVDCITVDANQSRITYAMVDNKGRLGEITCHESIDAAQILPSQIVKEMTGDPRRVARWHEFVRRVQAEKRRKKRLIDNARSREQPEDTESTSTRTVGRPSNPDDDWAYSEIKRGRKKREVYDDWLERIPDSRRQELADTWESFDKAMKYRQRTRGKKGEKTK